MFLFEPRVACVNVTRPAAASPYRGRLAPSPTGYLHLGHARTFWIAQNRCRQQRGTLVLRVEDLDRDRCQPEFYQAVLEDLAWFGFDWDEGTDTGGPCAPYLQSQRDYRAAFEQLNAAGHLYPCRCSRKDVLNALSAPHLSDEEPLYPGTCRPGPGKLPIPSSGPRISWRFRVSPGQLIQFTDAALGPQSFTAGHDFGDFVVWRHDDISSYQLAVVVDDAAMGITEVVRGADLLLSTARQILLYRALSKEVPMFYHCELLTDETGQRLAKRHAALSLRSLRQSGASPEQLRATWDRRFS